MTTKVLIANAPESNGDVILNAHTSCEGRIKDFTLAPGSFKELWITDQSAVILTETWPTTKQKVADEPAATDDDIISKCGDRGELWAKEFHKKNPHIDLGVALAWFSNCIEAACAVRVARYPNVGIQEIRGAVARAWCADPNREKEMDSDIAEAASQEIATLYHVDTKAG